MENQEVILKSPSVVVTILGDVEGSIIIGGAVLSRARLLVPGPKAVPSVEKLLVTSDPCAKEEKANISVSIKKDFNNMLGFIGLKS